MPAPENLQAYKHIVAFPYGANLDAGPDGLTARLSILSEIVVAAAVVAQDRFPTAKIIFPGERTFGDTFDGTTDLAARHVHSLGVDEDSFIGLHSLPDGKRKLNNTYLQTRAVAAYFGLVGGGGNTLTVGLNYHMPRIEQAMDAYGIPTDFVSAEDIVRNSELSQYDRYLPLLSEFGSRSEAAIRLLAKFDGKGHIPNLLTMLLGPRVADIYDNGLGKLTPYLSTGKRRLRELQRAGNNQTTHAPFDSAGYVK